MIFSKRATRNLVILLIGTVLSYLIEFLAHVWPLKTDAGKWLYLFYPFIFGMVGIMFFRGERIARLLNIFLLAVFISFNYVVSLQIGVRDPVALEGAVLHVMWIISSCVVGGLVWLPFVRKR